MARHTRQLPRDRQERGRAKQHEAGLLEQLERQAQAAHEVEAAARKAKEDLRRQILLHVQHRELDISDMADRTGVSRQTIHRWVARERLPFRVGQSVAHPYLGHGPVKTADRLNVHVQFELTSVTFDLTGELEPLTPL